MSFFEYLKIKRVSRCSKPSQRKLVHVRLDYCREDGHLTFKLLKDGSIQFWAYHEEQCNAWDVIYEHKEMVISKNELMPVLEYMQCLCSGTKLPQDMGKNAGDEEAYKPKIEFLYENFSLIDRENRELLKELCKFLHVRFPIRLLLNNYFVHLVCKNLAEFFMRFFIRYNKYVSNNFVFAGYYSTLWNLREHLTDEKLITDKELGRID
ncbi:hypothetical protein [uncultured Treponema sp.]|uniref:hypothetical protein n=1 Tax=uncultured Treponema sp. TaxID=162155 RepID=UPI0025E6CEA0|nr:hypothetical protein [uncultured Treponema sp.]